jgi:hypothetical protein
MVKWSDQLVSQHPGSVNHNGPAAARPTPERHPDPLALTGEPSGIGGSDNDAPWPR